MNVYNTLIILMCNIYYYFALIYEKNLLIIQIHQNIFYLYFIQIFYNHIEFKRFIFK